MRRKTRTFSVFAVMLCEVMLICVCTGCGSSGSTSKTVEKNSVVQGSVASEIPLNSTGNSSADEKAEPEELVYIKSFDLKSSLVTFDPIEWVTKEDTARIKELGLNAEDDFPSGFHINNPSEQTESLKLSRSVEYYIVKVHDSVTAKTDSNGLNKRIKEYKSPYHLTIENDCIIKTEEQYLP